MHGPAQILHRLIDAQAVPAAGGGAKPIVLHFQPAQDPHATLREGVAFDSLVAQVGRHPLEVLVQEAEHFVRKRGQIFTIE